MAATRDNDGLVLLENYLKDFIRMGESDRTNGRMMAIKLIVILLETPRSDEMVSVRLQPHLQSESTHAFYKNQLEKIFAIAGVYDVICSAGKRDAALELVRKIVRESAYFDQTLLVKAITGKLISVSVNMLETVRVAKQKISDQEGVPVDQQVLIYNGQRLEDNEKTLLDIMKWGGDIFHLIVKFEKKLTASSIPDASSSTTTSIPAEGKVTRTSYGPLWGSHEKPKVANFTEMLNQVNEYKNKATPKMRAVLDQCLTIIQAHQAEAKEKDQAKALMMIQTLWDEIINPDFTFESAQKNWLTANHPVYKAFKTSGSSDISAMNKIFENVSAGYRYRQ